MFQVSMYDRLRRGLGSGVDEHVSQKLLVEYSTLLTLMMTIGLSLGLFQTSPM
jgi:hypothetical protein